MKMFDEAVPESFTLVDGRWVFAFGEGYTLELEPIFGGGYWVALYELRPDRVYPDLLLREKVPMMPMLSKGMQARQDAILSALSGVYRSDAT
jgi:hypothetical protein